MSDKDPKAPPDLEEELQREQRVAEAELRDIERTKARAALFRLGEEHDAALDAGDADRAAELLAKMKQLAIELKKRFGY